MVFDMGTQWLSLGFIEVDILMKHASGWEEYIARRLVV
jgi:hypothetical protein